MNKKTLSLFLAFGLATSAFAVEKTFTETLATNPTTHTTADIEAQTGTLGDTVDLTVKLTTENVEAKNAYKWYWKPTTNINLASLNVDATLTRFYVHAGSDYTFSTVGDISVKSTASYGSILASGSGSVLGMNLNVGGSISSTGTQGLCLGHTDEGTLASLTVGGNVSGTISQLMVGQAKSTHSEENWSSAAMDIKGVLASSTNVSTFSSKDNIHVGHNYFKLGGINQSNKWTFSGRLKTAKYVELNSYYHIMITGSSTTNGGTAKMGGNIDSSIDTGQGGLNLPVVSFTMNSSDGNFTQSFLNVDSKGVEKDISLNFTGGVTLQSGTLLMDFHEISGVNHGTLTLSQVDGKKAIFGNASSQISKPVLDSGNQPTGEYRNATFLFSDIKVETSGIIKLRFDGTHDNGDFKIETISLANGGIAGDGTLVFDFGRNADDLAELIFDNAQNGEKIISWVDGNTSTAKIESTVDSFKVGDVTYNFESFAGADGLYVAYVAVPEPSTYAAIFGALALGLAIYRRRR